MSIKISNIIQHDDLPDSYREIKYTINEPVDFPYVAGKLQQLIPPEAGVSSKDVHYSKQSLFNQSELSSIVVPVSPKGLYYLLLRPAHILSQIIVEPEDVIVDIYFGENGLVYSFYNSSRRQAIAIHAKLAEDKEDVFNKLKSNAEDLTWRQYFIRRALIRPGTSGIEPPKDYYPDLMTAEQVAQYLQVEIKTIRNWTSQGAIPILKVGKSVRYPKAEIDNGNFHKKKTKSKKKN